MVIRRLPRSLTARCTRPGRKGGTYLDLAEVRAEIALRLRREVLVTEEDDRALGDKERELVLLLVRELRELQPDDLGADIGGEVLDLLRGAEERLLLLVGARARIVVFADAGTHTGGELDVRGTLCLGEEGQLRKWGNSVYGATPFPRRSLPANVSGDAPGHVG